MDVILIKEIARLGKAGEKVAVKDGYARNFLLPRGWALPATPGTLAQWESRRKARARQEEETKAKAVELSRRIQALSCAIPMPVGEQGKLHGAVTAGDILKALRGQGIELEKQQILLDKPITHLGSYPVAIKLHPEITAPLTVIVIEG